MSTLNKLSHTRLSHEILVTFTRMVMQHTTSHIEEIFLTRQQAALTIHLDEMDLAFQRTLHSSFTQELHQLDIRRDKLIVALRSHLNAAVDQAIIDQPKAEAAQQVILHLNQMDSRVTSLGYLEESAQIKAFLAMIKTVADETLQTSGAAPLLTALTEAQEAFDTTMQQKSNHDENREVIRPIKEIRKDITMRLEAILSYIAINGVDLPTEYAGTITNLNGLITEVMAKAKAEETRKSNQAS